MKNCLIKRINIIYKQIISGKVVLGSCVEAVKRANSILKHSVYAIYSMEDYRPVPKVQTSRRMAFHARLPSFYK